MRLTGPILRTIQADLATKCQVLCVEDDACRASNFGPNEEEDFVCELFNSSAAAMITEIGWMVMSKLLIAFYLTYCMISLTQTIN